jgi:CheY-like chemotaxis protein
MPPAGIQVGRTFGLSQYELIPTTQLSMEDNSDEENLNCRRPIEVRELVQVTLEIGDYQILSAENGQEAIEIAKAEHPDIILLDIMMPGSDIDGIEACRRLKADPATADITIVMLSAKGQENDIETGKTAGADDYFTKPFSPIALIEKVEAVIG